MRSSTCRSSLVLAAPSWATRKLYDILPHTLLFPSFLIQEKWWTRGELLSRGGKRRRKNNSLKFVGCNHMTDGPTEGGGATSRMQFSAAVVAVVVVVVALPNVTSNMWKRCVHYSSNSAFIPTDNGAEKTILPSFSLARHVITIETIITLSNSLGTPHPFLVLYSNVPRGRQDSSRLEDVPIHSSSSFTGERGIRKRKGGKNNSRT